MKTLRLILGDQLNSKHSWFRRRDNDVAYLMMEARQETDYAQHHIQKIVGFFTAMRAFARYLEAKGHHVIYIRLDDPGNTQSISDNVRAIIEREHFERFEYLLPDEYRLDHQLRELSDALAVDCAADDTEHFLAARSELRDFFRNRKRYPMESFYRHMRRSLGILMDGRQPVTGRWNYDAENRRPFDPKVAPPRPMEFGHDVRDIWRLVQSQRIKTMGTIDPMRFAWPVDRKEAIRMLGFFLRHCLVNFGTYQDAMSAEHISLFHSRLSFALNTKMLSPLEVVNGTLKYWQSHRRDIGIAQVEGFIRQIIGWREFMRGVYWAEMPGYRSMNFFGQKGRLPQWYWTGKTAMNCLKHVIGQSLRHAYAHHIQRLMVAGNFALLAGVDPDEVDNWYLGVYIDAIEWVETTNTRGMSQFADGGIVATKPYIASANYINRMSDYCDACPYHHSLRYGEYACPFNSLYWDFLMRHRGKLRSNPRMAVMYRTIDRMGSTERQRITEQAASYKRQLDIL
jgi:deoxyribodipyrimidine photolyase-related protein